MRFARPLPSLLLLALLLLFAVAPGCGAESEPPVAGQLRRSFPEQAAAVLDRREVFAPVAEGFVSRGADGEAPAPARIQAALPSSAREAIALHVEAHDFKIMVRESDAAGDSVLAGGAVTYARSNGSSFWAATDAGIEEWLLLDAGVARAGHVVASWTIEGGAVRKDGDAIMIDDEAGTPRVRVTAPAAFAAGGRSVSATLSAHGATIDLTVDADGEAALVDPLWVAASVLKIARYSHSGTVLGNGKVLVVGGYGTGGAALASAELYDPALDAWSMVASLATPRAGHRAVLLGSGKVLVVGGTGTAGALTSAEIYDAALNTWAPAGAMTLPRDAPQMALVGTGNARVLVTGGVFNGLPTNLAELYDPVANSWSAAAPMLVAHSTHSATLLSTNEVLVVGGRSTANISVSNAELYVAATNTWTATAPLPSPRAEHNATLMLAGKVGVTGGINWTTPGSGSGVQSIVVYDAIAKTWTQGGGTGYHDYGTATLLANGGLMLAGGNVNPMLVDFLDPLGAAWTNAGPLLGLGHTYHTASLLGNGKVLLTGGYSGAANMYLQTCDLYSPYVASTTCSLPGECQSGFCVDGFCCNTVCSGSCKACSAAKTGGVNGTCGNVTVATDPDADCAAQATATCGTNGSCDGAGKCQLYLTGTSCLAPSCMGSTLDNGSACNGTGTCTPNGTVSCAPYGCTGSACNSICLVDTDCSSGNLCINGKCGSPLPDGAACGGSAQCNSGNCVDGVCCNTACNGGACDACSVAAGAPTDGVCAPLSGNACDDGNICTQADTCLAGACVPGSPVQCAAIDMCHTAGVCDPAMKGCTNPVAIDGTSCVDKNGCTQNDTCMQGKCVGGPVCPSADPCQVGSCNALGTCDYNPAADSTPCDDGDLCTQKDVCAAGACTGMDPVACAPADKCHDKGSCVPKTGVCQDGATLTPSCSFDPYCEIVTSACDKASGECAKSAKPDGAPCNGTGECLAGTCLGGVGTSSVSTGTASTGSASTGSASTGSTTTGSAGTASTGSAGTGVGGSGSGSTGPSGSGGNSGDGTVSPAGGCGCTTASTSDSESRAPWLLLGVVLVASRRRQRRLTA